MKTLLRAFSIFQVGAFLALTFLLSLPTCTFASGLDSATPALGNILEPDGTVKSGAYGSFDPTGYTLDVAPDGQPTFRPTAVQHISSQKGAGDGNWSDAFTMNGTNGTVYALAIDGNGNVYAGGNFTTVGGIAANYVAKWNGSTWMSLGTGTNGIVRTLAVDSNDNVYAGGGFATAGGIAAARVAKWNGTTWSGLGAGINGTVNALAVDGNGNLYAGGVFTAAGAIVANCVAMWNGTAWSGMGTGINTPFSSSSVFALAVDGSGNVYAGGYFKTAGNVIANGVAKWDGGAWLALGTGINIGVYALAVDGSGNLYAGGNFTMAGGVATDGVAKWNGSAWNALGADTNSLLSNGGISALAVDGSGNLYVGGAFAASGGTPSTNYLTKWDGTAWSGLGSGISGVVDRTNGVVNALAVRGNGNLYNGGNFGVAGDAAVNNLAQWNNSSATWAGVGLTTAGAGINGLVYELVADGIGNLYAAGNFTTAGRVVAGRVAKWNGTAWAALGSGMDGVVSALTVDGSGNLYAAGDFTTAGGVAASHIAKWNGTAWSALGAGINGIANALAIDGSGNLYAGGDFTMAGGVAASRVAKWNGTAWAALGAGANGVVRALLIDGSNIYAGGGFLTAGGIAASRVAKWNGTAWSALGAGTSNVVYALAKDGSGNVYAGGSFVTAGNITANCVAKWDGNGWSALATGFNSSGTGTVVLTLATDGSNNVYAGGNIYAAGSVITKSVAKWNGTDWSGLGTGTNYGVYKLLSSGGGIYAGGEFTAVGDGSKAMVHIGYYSSTPLAMAAAQPFIQLSMFPNPARTSTTVYIPAVAGATKAALTLIDELGRMVRSQRLNLPAAGTTTEIPLTGLAPGLYQLRVQAGGQQVSRTLAVE